MKIKLHTVFYNFNAFYRILTIGFIAVSVLLVGVSSVLAKSHEHFKIHLRWKIVPGAVHYKVQISPRKNFKKIIEEVQTDDPEWVWNYEKGSLGTRRRYFYRVAALDQYGDSGDFSNPREILLPKASQLRPSTTQKSQILTSSSVPAPIHPKLTQRLQHEEDKNVLKVDELIGFWRFDLAVQFGFGSFSQKSDVPELKNVSLASAFAQRRLSFQITRWNFIQSASEKKVWSLYFQFEPVSFQKSLTPRSFDQPDISSFFFRANALKWKDLTSHYKFAYGLSLDRSFRWTKSGTESVVTSGGIAFGPIVQFTFEPSLNSVRLFKELGLSVGVPLTGKLTTTQIGLDGALWSELLFVQSKKIRLGFRVEGDLDVTQWDEPKSTQFVFWSLWGAILVHF